MRIESSVTSVSWLPSETVRGIRRLPFSIGAARHDEVPPDAIDDAASLVKSGAVRQANRLEAWVEVNDRRIAGAGYSGGGHARGAEVDVRDERLQSDGAALPILQAEPEIDADGSARFVQTFGARMGVPVPRRIAGVPLFRMSSSIAWTTLSLTIRADGSSQGALVDASPFPRHWVYDAEGRLLAKSAEIDVERWLSRESEAATPWGTEASRVYVTAAESQLERDLSREIMSTSPRVLSLSAGDWLTEQGAIERGAFLILDGILDVYVGGQEVAEVGPGSVVGERAGLDGGRRSATLQARTNCRVAVFDPSDLEPAHVSELADRHRGEHQ